MATVLSLDVVGEAPIRLRDFSMFHIPCIVQLMKQKAQLRTYS